jgi:histone H3/H4
MAKKKKAAGKPAKKAGKKSSGGRDSLVVGSKVKAYIRGKGAKSAGELPSAISEAIYSLIDKAIDRAVGNKRSTVQPRDL